MRGFPTEGDLVADEAAGTIRTLARNAAAQTNATPLPPRVVQ
jgi:hypothetical protein